MIQEEKELLLKDLCARLPYGIKIKFDSIKETVFTISELGYLSDFNHDIKPYLRPMSSMTEEEKKEFQAFHCVDEWNPEFHQAMCNLPNINNMINWLDKKMFDHRGLIPIGLALPAKEGMYNIE